MVRDNNFERGFLHDVGDAQIAAEAEKPLRDAALTKGLLAQQKKSLEEVAVKSGEEALSVYREKQSYRDKAQINGIEIKVAFIPKIFGGKEGGEVDELDYGNIIEGDDQYEITLVDKSKNDFEKAAYVGVDPDNARFLFESASFLAQKGLSTLKIHEGVIKIRETIEGLKG